MPIDYSWIGKTDIAHRGLYKAGSEREENSLAAIEKAVDAGYAIEIDVRMTTDERVVVFHDARLERLTSGRGFISESHYTDLEKLTLGQSNQKIPTLNDVLEVVNERVPLYIEAKCPHKMDVEQLCAGIRYSLEGYIGNLAIMSFNPGVPKWLKDNFPDYARGLVVDYRGMSGWQRTLLTRYALSRCDPHFLAMDVNSLPNKMAKKWTRAKKPLLTWTVKSEGQVNVGRENADALIFEAPAIVGSDMS